MSLHVMIHIYMHKQIILAEQIFKLKCDLFLSIILQKKGTPHKDRLDE